MVEVTEEFARSLIKLLAARLMMQRPAAVVRLCRIFLKQRTQIAVWKVQ